MSGRLLGRRFRSWLTVLTLVAAAACTSQAAPGPPVAASDGTHAGDVAADVASVGDAIQDSPSATELPQPDSLAAETDSETNSGTDAEADAATDAATDAAADAVLADGDSTDTTDETDTTDALDAIGGDDLADDAADATVEVDGLADGAGTGDASGDGMDADPTLWSLEVPLATPCTAGACDDGNSCTFDTCNAATGKCSHLFGAYSNSMQEPCHQDLMPCVGNYGCTCDVANRVCVDCLGTGSCNVGYTTGKCVDEHCIGPTCDSSYDCNYPKTCVDGFCVECSATIPCPGKATCQDGKCVKSCSNDSECPYHCLLPAGKCVDCLKSSECPFGEFCNGSHHCEQARCGVGKCANINGQVTWFKCRSDFSGYEAPIACPSPSPGGCTVAACNDVYGCGLATSNAPCDDGDPCSAMGECQGDICIGTVNCNDDDPCTADSCLGAPKGCQHVPLPDASTCSDGDPCTADSCQSGKCVALPLDGTPCNDGNPCHAKWLCVAGTCTGDMDLTANCDDGKECTVDQCSKQGKCTHTAEWGKPCDLNNPCAVSTCGYYGCEVTMALAATCTDGDPCTTDACVKGECASSVPSAMVLNDSSSQFDGVAALNDGTWLAIGTAFSSGQGMLHHFDATGKTIATDFTLLQDANYASRHAKQVVAAGAHAFVLTGYVESPASKDNYWAGAGWLGRAEDTGKGMVFAWQHAYVAGDDGALVAATNLGGVIIAVGQTKKDGQDDRGWVLAVDEAGKAQWQALAPTDGWESKLVDVAAANGQVFAAGNRNKSKELDHCWQARLAADGAWLATTALDTGGYCVVKAVAAVAGGSVVVGSASPDDGGATAWWWRGDADGNPVPGWPAPPAASELNDVAVLPGGGLIVVGQDAGGHAIVIRTDPNGAALQIHPFGGSSDEIAAVAASATATWAVGTGYWTSPWSGHGGWRFAIDAQGLGVCVDSGTGISD